MLQPLIRGEVASSRVIIQDNVSAKSDVILSSFLHYHSKRLTKESLHLLCSERSVNEIVSSDVISRIKVTDMFSDPLGWISTKPEEKVDILGILNDRELNQKTVCIESVNHMLLCYGMVEFSKYIVKLSELSKGVIACVHKDSLLYTGDAHHLKYLATTHIDVLQRLDQERFLVEVLHKKPDGRLDRIQKEIVSVDPQFNISSFVYTVEVKKPVVKPINMESLTTFNLGTEMKPSEKEARDQLVLPYMNKEVGDIEYEADNVDLEEDPDDDLEL